MAQITLPKREWQKHLGQFQSNVNDLSLIVYDNPVCLGYAVAYQTYFYKMFQQYPGVKVKPGRISVSDLSKVNSFLKKCDGEVTMRQADGGKTLYIINGNLKMTLPVMDVLSDKIVSNYEKLIETAGEDDWRTFGDNVHTLSATTKLTEVLRLSGLTNLVSKNADYTISANDSEISVSVGKQHDTRMFAVSQLEDVDGPNHTIESNFGPWLLPCLSLVDANMKSKIHFGDQCAIIIRQTNESVQRLLVIIDQMM